MANSMESRGKQRKEITDVPGKEGWVLKSFFWIVVLERTLESLLDCKEIKPLDPKENQSWIFIGSTDVKAETPVFWSPDVKNWFIGKDTDAGKDWRQEEKGETEDEMVGITNSMDVNVSKLQEIVEDRGVWPALQVHGVAKSWTQLSDWTTIGASLIGVHLLCVTSLWCSHGMDYFQFGCEEFEAEISRPFLKNEVGGTSLVVQWPRLHLPVQCSTGLIPDRGVKFNRDFKNDPKKKNLKKEWGGSKARAGRGKWGPRTSMPLVSSLLSSLPGISGQEHSSKLWASKWEEPECIKI